jgi:hypothetical protein
LEITHKNPSAKLLQEWIEGDTFVWLVSDEILLEYKRILARLGVRRPLIGKILNLLREEAELVPASVLPNISPDPGDDPFCALRWNWPGRFQSGAEPKRFPAITLISSCDQTWRAQSNNSPPETTPPGPRHFRASLVGSLSDDTDPADKTDPRRLLRKKIPELEPALEGKLEEHHRFLLELQPQRLVAAEKDLAVLEPRIRQMLEPYIRTV